MTARNLKDLREEYNFNRKDNEPRVTQQDIANLAGIKKTAVSKIETGDQKPSLKVYLAYSRMLNISLEYILDDSVKAKQPQNATISRDLGITDDVISTMKFINEMSNHTSTDEYNKIFHAFIGNGQTTISFLQQILNYLNRQYQFEHFTLDNSDNPNEAINMVATNTATIDALMISSIMAYINNVIKPQLKDVLEHKYQEALMISEIPDEVKYS